MSSLQFRIGMAVLLCAVSGCSATRSWSPLASKEPPAKVSEEQPNPFKSRGKTPKDGGKSIVATTDDQSLDAEIEQLSGGDPELRKLLDEELRQLPPKERETVLKGLRNSDPSMARQILQAQRLMRQLGQKDANRQLAKTDDGAQPAEKSFGDVQTASNEEPIAGTGHSSQLEPFRRSHSGLGATDPWSNGGAPAKSNGKEAAANAPPAASGEAMTFGEFAEGAVPKEETATLGDLVNDAPGHSAPFGETAAASDAIPTIPKAPAVTPQEDRGVQLAQFAPRPFGESPTVVAPQQTPAPADEIAAAAPGTDPNAAGGPVRILPSIDALPLQPPPAGGVLANQEPVSPLAPSPTPPSRVQRGTVVAWGSELQKLISVAEAEVATASVGTTDAEKHAFIEKHVHLRMLYLIAGQQERALEAIPGIDPADQEFWQQVFWSTANYFDTETMPQATDRATQTVAQLRTAIERLQAKANLELRNVTFCHKIVSFGNCSRYERDEFSPGQPVLVYAEVNNFKSELASDGQYRTILKSTTEIYKPNGDLVATIPLQQGTEEDLCRNHRRDYFQSYKLVIPNDLPRGPHTLKLTVVDQLSQKVATATLNFTVR